MKRWMRWLGMVLAVVGSVAFIAYVVSSLRIEDLRIHLSTRVVIAAIAATMLYSLTVPISAFAWQRLLASLGHRQAFVRLNAILLTTQAGKYLPGNIGQHLGRIGLALAQGIPLPVLVASMAYEVLLLMLAGVLVGLVGGALSEPGLSLLQGQGTVLMTAITLAIAGLFAIPLLGKMLPWVVARIERVRGSTPGPMRTLGLTTPPLLIAIYALAYLVIGAATSLLAIGLFPEADLDFPLLTAAFAIAWVVGFVTPGAPAGIGVREAVLLLLLGGSMGPVEISLLILALRIVTTLGDILCFAAGLAQMAWLRLNDAPAHGPRP